MLHCFKFNKHTFYNLSTHFPFLRVGFDALDSRISFSFHLSASNAHCNDGFYHYIYQKITLLLIAQRKYTKILFLLPNQNGYNYNETLMDIVFRYENVKFSLN